MSDEVKNEEVVADDYEHPTWGKLRDFLNNLPPDSPILQQRMEILPHTYDYTNPTHLLPVVTWGTVEELLHVNGEVSTETRSAEDFTHRPDLFILTADSSPYDEEGNMFFDMQDDGSLVGNKTGTVKPGPFSTAAPEGFYTSKLRFTVTTCHQFGPDRAISMVKGLLNVPAILDAKYIGGQTNYALHGPPAAEMHPITRKEAKLE